MCRPQECRDARTVGTRTVPAPFNTGDAALQRAVAISGPTPAMIGWTVLRDCGLRRLDGRFPADAASRQLRGLVTWSRAVNEGRLLEGWCFHPDCDGEHPEFEHRTVSADSAADWLGFPQGEPLVAFGGEAVVRQACGECPVNVGRESGGVGGCWGWLPFNLGPLPVAEGRQPAGLRAGNRGVPLGGSRQDPSLPQNRGVDDVTSPGTRPDGSRRAATNEQGRKDRLRTGQWDNCSTLMNLRLAGGESLAVLDATTWLEEVLADLRARESFERLFPPTQPPWSGLWIGSEWSREQCGWWVEWCELAVSRGLAGVELVRLGAAVKAALETGLRFVFERVPPGLADGQAWHWPAHCGRCGHIRAVKEVCRCCGEQRGAVAASQRRVMGLRPWLKLARLMPAEQLEQLAGRYLAFRKQARR